MKLKKWIILLAFAASIGRQSFGSFDTETNSIQTAIENEIRSLISGQLSAGEYFIYATVERSESAAGQPKAQESVELPFSTLTFNRSELRSLFEKNHPGEIFRDMKITVSLSFDERIPEVKRQMIEKVIRERFGFDGTTRILNVSTLNLVTPPIALEKTLVFEKERLESDRAKMALEMERAKLELSKRELEIAEKGRDAAAAAAAAAAATKAPQATDGTAGSSPAAQSEKGPIQEYQLLIFGTVLAIVALVGILLGGGILRKGLTPLSSSIGQVAEGIKAGGAKEGGSSAPAQSAPQAASPAPAGHDSHSPGPSHGKSTAMVEAPAAGDESFQQFIDMVQDKIDILVREKNFGFYRHLADMIDDSRSLAKAAALLVNLNAESVRNLTTSLSARQMTKVRNFLETPGAFAESRTLRAAALQEFYSRIAMDEYMDSPLMQLKDLDWLVKMSNSELGRLILGLQKKEQLCFLASLTPHRVKLVLATLTSPNERDAIISLLAEIGSVDGNDVVQNLNALSKKMSQKEQAGGDSKSKVPAVDAAKFIATIAEDLRSEDQEKILAALPDSGSLRDGVREHFLPFSEIKKLPKSMLLEIFSPRTNLQIAQILFDAPNAIQDFVIKAMPDIRASSIEDELNILKQNKAYQAKNAKASNEMQREIAKYVLKMIKDGIISFEVEPPGEASNAA